MIIVNIDNLKTISSRQLLEGKNHKTCLGTYLHIIEGILAPRVQHHLSVYENTFSSKT